MPIASGSTAISKMYVGGTLVSAAYANSASLLFNPSSLFAASEQGAWYDPSDWSTLFQDAAGTAPVTAMGQPVGLMLDKSGRGNHAAQPTAINRPVLQIDGNGKYYLAFNGSNQWMSTPSIDFTATDKMTVVAGVRKLSDGGEAYILELSTNFGANAGSFAIRAPRLTAAQYGFSYNASGAAGYDATTFAAPISSVLAMAMNGSGSAQSDKIIARVNGITPTLTLVGGASGSGNFRNYPLYIGSHGGGSAFFNGQLYGLVVRGALSDATQIGATETFVNAKTGAY